MSRTTPADLHRSATARTATLTLGLLAAGATFAPAALAEEPTPHPTTSADATPATGERAATPEVLTPSPTPSAPAPATDAAPAAAAADDAPIGPWFGWGKLQVDVVAAEGSVPAGTDVDLTGVEVTVVFEPSYVLTGSEDQLAATEALTAVCTFDVEGDCVFAEADPRLSPMSDGSVWLPPDAVASFSLTEMPSGQLLAGDDVLLTVHSTDEPADDLTAAVVVTAPGAYRTLGVSSSAAGATYSLCTVAGGSCAGGAGTVSATTDANGRATFPGLYLPGTYTVTQTAVPAGQTLDTTARPLTVPAATTLAERDTTVRLTVGAPVTSAPPAPPAPQTPPAVTVSSQDVRAGAQQTVTLYGFLPFEMVRGVLYSTPVELGTVQADANGAATFTFTVPAGFELGQHTITMTGVTSGVSASDTFTVSAAVAAAARPTGGLAYTGADVVPVLALGGTLLAAGSGALVLARRRRAS